MGFANLLLIESSLNPKALRARAAAAIDPSTLMGSFSSFIHILFQLSVSRFLEPDRSGQQPAAVWPRSFS
jgi:hypothetical protein